MRAPLADPAGPIRCAIVPPVPVPYREPLYDALAAEPGLTLRVIYQADRQPGWDAPAAWFPHEHAYDAVHLCSLQRARPGGTPVVWPRGLERALQRFDPACVVAWEYGPAALRALAWCRLRRRAFVIFSECTPQLDARLSAAHLRLHRWLARRADGFVVASSAARERLLALGVAPERIEVSVQSADAAPLRAIEREGRPAGRPVRFLAVGRLVEDKNLARLLDAFAAAGLAPGEAELEVCGIGPLEGELRAQATRLGLSVRFRGHVEGAELAAAYRDADAFALVSTFEPFGVVVREAAAAALPVICSRVAGAAGDVAVEGESALLVDPLDVAGIGDALRRLAGDAALRRTLGERGRAIEARLARDGVAAFQRAVADAVARRARR
jgi:glycosyltransferase involved in cell wall biosynthesis